MKKYLIILIIILCCPLLVNAYSFDGVDIDSEVLNLLNELQLTWPTGLQLDRIELIKQAASLVNKGIVYGYGGGHGTCNENPQALDCSGYVSLAFHKAGLNPGGCSWSTINYNSSKDFPIISESQLKPGDIGLNNSGLSSVNHIGIYIGQKQGKNYWLHSSTVSGKSGPQVRVGNGRFTVFRTYAGFDDTVISSDNGSSSDKNGADLENVGGGKELLTIDKYPNYPLINSSDDFKCETIFLTVSKDNTVANKPLKTILDVIFVAIRIFAPVFALSLTINDYIKVLSTNGEGLKKANIRMFKRIALAICILFLPSLLELLFQAFGLYDLSNCIVT